MKPSTIISKIKKAFVTIVYTYVICFDFTFCYCLMTFVVMLYKNTCSKSTRKSQKKELKLF